MDDLIIQRLIKAVRRTCEKRTKRFFVPVNVTVIANIVSDFYLPRLPVSNVSSVENWDQDNSTYTVVDPSKYYAEGEILVIKEYTYNSKYKILYTAGYTELPEDIEQAQLHEIAYRYENRGNLNVKPDLHETTIKLLEPYMNLRYSI